MVVCLVFALKIQIEPTIIYQSDLDLLSKHIVQRVKAKREIAEALRNKNCSTSEEGNDGTN